jgi:hypothetical protein
MLLTDLKPKNTHDSGSFGTHFHIVWMGDGEGDLRGGHGEGGLISSCRELQGVGSLSR